MVLEGIKVGQIWCFQLLIAHSVSCWFEDFTSPMSFILKWLIHFLLSPMRRFVVLQGMIISNMETHMFGTFDAPRFLVNDIGENIMHKKYTKFQQRFNSLIPWLLASICPQINICLLDCINACFIWSKLRQVFSTSSTTRIMSLYLWSTEGSQAYA